MCEKTSSSNFEDGYFRVFVVVCIHLPPRWGLSKQDFAVSINLPPLWGF